MTDLFKKTAAMENLEDEAHREVVSKAPSTAVLEGIASTQEVIKMMANRFNAMRAQLSTFIDLVRNQDSEAMKYAVMAKSVANGDYGLLLDEGYANPKTIDVEEAGLFTQKMEELSRTKRYETRIRMCIDLNNLISEAIEGWKSKIEKMQEIGALRGSSEAETTLAKRKIVQFNLAIEVLRKRGGQVSNVYFDARKQITNFLDKANAEFKIINYNNPLPK